MKIHWKLVRWERKRLFHSFGNLPCLEVDLFRTKPRGLLHPWVSFHWLLIKQGHMYCLVDAALIPILSYISNKERGSCQAPDLKEHQIMDILHMEHGKFQCMR